MSSRMARVLVCAAATTLGLPVLVNAAPMYDVELVARVQGSGNPYSHTVTVQPGDTLDYKIMISLAAVGTSNTQGSLTRFRDSGGTGEGVNLVKFNLYQDAASNSAVNAVFGSGVTLSGSWGGGTSSAIGTVSSGDLLTVVANLPSTAGVDVGELATGTFTIAAGAEGTGFVKFGLWDPSYITGGSTAVSGKVYGHTSSNSTSQLLTVTATATYTSSVQGGTEAGSDPLVNYQGLTLVGPAVPEPAALGVLGFGVLGLLSRRRRSC